MQNDPFVILGIAQDATQAEILEAYKSLKAQYSQQRFLEGAAGAEAAKKLTQLEVAYQEAMEYCHQHASVSGGADELGGVRDALRGKRFDEAQSLLDNVSNRGAEWHYLQSVVFYNKNWLDESKKQLEIAVEMDSGNSKYREALDKLNTRINGQNPYTANPQPQAQQTYNQQQGASPNYQQQYGEDRSYTQRSGSSNGFCNACSTCLIADCCCECMGGDLIRCC